jgi:GTPase
MTSSHSTSPIKPKALLVGITLPGQSDEETQQSLAELERLVTTLGLEPVGKLWQKRPNLASGIVLGEGKLKELAKQTGGTGEVESKAQRIKTRYERRLEKEAAELEVQDELVENDDFSANLSDEESEDPGSHSLEGAPKAQTVVFDCELSPSQITNLQAALGVEVLDRTGVIVEIFSRHARTRQARIQVEMARLSYLAPRLRESGGGGDRGGGGGTGGRDKARRKRRVEQNTVALVGYTNAGKSSLMRALTGSDVLVENKLFATLDTTVRALQPESNPRILISDTVGFIKKLPHDLVASFRSTLDEAAAASLLLFVVDSSDPQFREQLKVTEEVLGEMGVIEAERWLVLNKQDNLSDDEKAKLKLEFPQARFLSTRDSAQIKDFRQQIVEFFSRDFTEAHLFLPYAHPHLVGEARRHLQVLNDEYDEQGVVLRVRGSHKAIELFLEKNPEASEVS